MTKRNDLTPLTRAAVWPHRMFRGMYSPSLTQPGTWLCEHWETHPDGDAQWIGLVRLPTAQAARDLISQTGRIPFDSVVRLDSPKRTVRRRPDGAPTVHDYRPDRTLGVAQAVLMAVGVTLTLALIVGDLMARGAS